MGSFEVIGKLRYIMALQALVSAVVIFMVLFALPSRAWSAVVISEIHYHPPKPDGDRLEFVEIWNTGPTEIDTGGWRFVRGIRFTFPEGSVVSSGGRLLIARDANAYPNHSPLGGFSGSLANEGEELTLVNAKAVLVDSVFYDDGAPWPDGDGGGFSLQRLCAEESSTDPSNWRAGNPTPSSDLGGETCDLPPAASPSVVISEIFYHPPLEIHGREDDLKDKTEFVELYNLLDQTVNVGGWKFVDGIEYTIPDGVTISPHSYLVVARNPDLLVSKFQGLSTSKVVGPFVGQLSNSGERITLADGAEIVDSVYYLDSGSWPYAADGEGRSLEKIFLAGAGGDPANWCASQVPRGDLLHFEVVGPVGPYVDEDADDPEFQSTFLIALAGVGEAIVESVSLEDTASPGVELLANASFDSGLESWNRNGNARDLSTASEGGGELEIRTGMPCPLNGCVRCTEPVPNPFVSTYWERCQGFRELHGLSQSLPISLDQNATYRLSIRARSIEGDFDLRAGFSSGTQIRTCLASPGAANSRQRQASLPLVSGIGRSPSQPRSSDETTITARVRSEEDPRVLLSFGRSNRGDSITLAQELVMLDDGVSGDGDAGDGIYGVRLPAFSHNSQIRFRILVQENGKTVAISPRPMDDDVERSHEVWGYYVNDNQPSSDLPIFQVLIDGVDGSDFREVDESLHCRILRPASFAFQGELYPDISLRFRGNTACMINKRNFKLRFNRGRPFDGLGDFGLKKINLNGMWTDKAIIREKLAWDVVEEMGAPYMETFFLRLHVSGEYFGLFLYVEHPDNRFLERNGLDPDGNLYKAVQPSPLLEEPGVRRMADGQYFLGWEEEVRRGGGFQDVESFVSDLHADAEDHNPTSQFFGQNVLEDMMIQFQLSNVILQNWDTAKKNHFLYHDRIGDRWGLVSWDLDLTFGKFFSKSVVDTIRENPYFGRQTGTLNDRLLSEIDVLFDPWARTSLGHSPENANAAVDFFFRADESFYRRAYLVRLWTLLFEKYRNDRLDPVIDGMVDFLGKEIDDDLAFWGRFPTNLTDPLYRDDVDYHIDRMKNEISYARRNLLDFITSNHREFVDPPRLKITEILYYPPGGDFDRQFVELFNPTGQTIDVTGWTIDGLGFEFPAERTIGPHEVVVLTRNTALFEARYPDHEADHVFAFAGFLASDGEVLRLRDGGPGADGPGSTYPATVDYLKYGVGGQWPEVRPGFSIELATLTVDQDNDPGRSWRHSALAGGSPGSVHTVFVRGNVNSDSWMDVNDAILMLRYLLIDEPLNCHDAADADDSGVIDIGDPIYWLEYLFLGRSPPPEPFSEPGEDLTPDGLGCRAI